MTDRNQQPMIAISLWYAGPEEQAKTAFSSIYDLDPVMQTSEPTPYNKTNAPSEHVCKQGDRKPCWSVGMQSLDAKAMRETWDNWNEYTENYEEAKGTVVLTEAYGWGKVREVKESSTAFPHRNYNFMM